MRIHFFAAPFFVAFIWFRVRGSGFEVQGSRFRVRGSGFKVQVAASPPFFRRWYSHIAAFPSRGKCPKGADRVTMA